MLALVSRPVAAQDKYNISAAVIGTTPAQIAERAPAIIAGNLAKLPLAKLRTFTYQELSDIGHYSPQAISIIESRDAGVTAVRQRYALRVYAAPSSTGVFNTLQEIYLDFRTGPGGGLSPGNALYETISYAGQRLILAYGVGTLIGSVIHQLIELYDPALDDAIGGTVQIIIEEYWPVMAQYQAGSQSTSQANYYFNLYEADYNAGYSEALLAEQFGGLTSGYVTQVSGVNVLGDWGVLNQIEDALPEADWESLISG